MLAIQNRTHCSEGRHGLTRPQHQKTRKAWRARILTATGGLVAAAVSLGYSVYQQRIGSIVPQVELATPIEAGRWDVSILSSSFGSALPNGLPVSSDKRVITVEMTLENISSESSNLYGDLIELANIPEAPKPQYYLVRDQAILWDLQPRMPETVAAVWEVPADLDRPADLQLRIEGAFFKPRDNLYAAPGWFPAGSVAKVDVPLKDKPAESTP